MRALKLVIREIKNWPIKGVNFKDITPLLKDKKLFRRMVNLLAKPYIGKRVDKVVGIDARGFILAAAVAYKLKSGLAIARKKGKLPWKKVFRKYALEYGSNTIEMHKDSISPGDHVLMIDDVLATGGTMMAAIDLVKKLKGKIIGIEFLIELGFLNGRKVLSRSHHTITSLIKY